jgi:omega-amidase
MMKIYAIQLDTIWQNLSANHQKIRDMVAVESIEAGSLIVLPEMFDTGFSMNTEFTAQPDDLPSDNFIKELAAETKCCVMAGIVSPMIDTRPANEVIAIDPQGNERARFRKIHPFSYAGEDEKYVAGTEHTLFQWDDVTIAPFICYDLRFPESFRPAAQNGAQLIIVVANWPQKRSDHWFHLLRARAIENQAYVLGVNRCGADEALTYDGRTSLFDPYGNTVFELDAYEQIKAVDIDISVVDQWRKEFPALNDIV